MRAYLSFLSMPVHGNVTPGISTGFLDNLPVPIYCENKLFCPKSQHIDSTGDPDLLTQSPVLKPLATFN